MVKTASYSDQGGREYNEDCHKITKNDNIICAMVADGLGGHGGGSIASATAVAVISDCFENHLPNEQITEFEINTWFNEANEVVISKQTPACEMKTTMAMICFELCTDKVLLAHLGDTRIYHFVNGKVSSMTFDHSVSRMAVLSGEISMDQIRFHHDRNKLIKAIGKGDEVHPEINEIKINRNVDNAFLICTDGFWEYVTEDVMEKTLKKSASPKEWLKLMRAHLRKNAKEGNDNNTAIVISIN